MKNFGRALSHALRYRWTLVGIVTSSLAVAVLWGTNLGAVYPFVEVVMKGQSLRAWADQRVASAQSDVQQQQSAIAELELAVEKATGEPGEILIK